MYEIKILAESSGIRDRHKCTDTIDPISDRMRSIQRGLDGCGLIQYPQLFHEHKRQRRRRRHTQPSRDPSSEERFGTFFREEVFEDDQGALYDNGHNQVYRLAFHD